MIKKINVTKLVYFKGSKHGVVGATALMTLDIEGQPDEAAFTRLRSYRELMALNPGDPHYGVDPESWVSSFVRNVSKKPDFAHIIAAYIVAFQRWARDPVAKAIVITRSTNRIILAIPWQRQNVCKTSLVLSLKYAVIANFAPPQAEQQIKFNRLVTKFLQQAHEEYLAPNTVRFALAAMNRNIPVSVLNTDTIQLGWGAGQTRMRSSFTGQTSNIATNMARNKLRANQRLRENRLPVPRAAAVESIRQAEKAVEVLGWPVVVKPAALDQGAGVVAGINDVTVLGAAFHAAQKMAPGPIVIEKHIDGDDHRMLVVKGRLLMTTRRIPGGVTGDGESTIEQLIEETNRDPLRGKGKRSMMIELKLDDLARSCLAEKGLTAMDIPDQGQFIALRKTANISTGGTAIDVSDTVHPDNKAAAIRAARILDLDIAGVDFLCPDISQSYRQVGGAICEVNAQPGFRPHWLSDPGRDINGEVIDILTADTAPRIPTVAITGTNGKSTTAKMLHHIWQASGKTAGVCTTAGTWVGEDKIDSDNLSGYPGARLLFQDPAVESAIIEMPRKGLIVFGQPCDAYDVAALLNIADDHIGVDGINSMEEMARLKAQVIACARHTVLINADDELCLEMRRYIKAPRIILMAQSRSNRTFSDHLQNGGEGAFIKMVAGQEWLVFAQGSEETHVISVADMPSTQGGLIHHNILNALSAMALARAQGLPLESIRRSLSTFENTVEVNPGRYNYIDGFPFQLMVDFAHNAASAATVVEYIENLPVEGRRILFSRQLGNRHRADFTRVAPDLSRVFDEIVVTTNPDRAGQNPEYAGDNPNEIMLAFARQELLEAGFPAGAITTETDLPNAISIALSKAGPGDFVLMLTDLKKVSPFLEKLLASEESG